MASDAYVPDQQAEDSRVPLREQRFGTMEMDVRDHEHRMSHVVTLGQVHSPPPGTESTDFDLHESKQYIDHVKQMGRIDRKLKGFMRWILLATIGISTGLVATGIDTVVSNVFEQRAKFCNGLVEKGYGMGIQYAVYVGICLALAAVAGFLVCFVEPLAAGSGIPEVKCFLNGVHLPRVVDFKTLIVKAPGVMFSVAAGMPCGKEGPMIHSGSCIGGVVAKKGTGPLLRPYRADVEIRDFVTAGAASGVAAAFGAPLGGVLFAMEEGATFFTPLIMLRTFWCTIAATVTVRFMLTGIEGKEPWGTMGSAAPLSFGRFEDSSYRIWELPIFCFMGAAGGLAGALFNHANTLLTKWRMKHIGGRGPKRYVEVWIITFCVASATFFMPILLSNGEMNSDKFKLAQALWRSPGTHNINHLFHVAEDYETIPLLTFGCIYYALACWVYGLGVPSGLFVPSLLTGAAFGRLFGQLISPMLGLTFGDKDKTDAGVYALMGATAALSGMARITVSLAVILMEASGSVQWALPIFVTTMCSKWAGDFFTIGLYDIHIELKHIPLLEAQPDKEFIMLKAKDVMSKADDNKTLAPVERVEKIKQILECPHNGFPVVNPNSGKYVGLIKRSNLCQVLYRGKEFGAFQPEHGDLENPPPVVPYKDARRERPTSEITQNLTPDDLKQRIDLRPYVNQGSYTIPEYAALTRVYMLFRAMGLRHLPVLSSSGYFVGMITRKDLILAHDAEDHEEGGEQSFRAQEPTSSEARRASVTPGVPSIQGMEAGS